jgi:hypothetical protein
MTPNLQVISGKEAILAGLRKEWEAPIDAPTDLWVDDQLGLRDFRNLAAYLARSTATEPDGANLLKQLLEKVGEDRKGISTSANG